VGVFTKIIFSLIISKRFMRSIIFATNNQHKVSEIRAVLKDTFQIISLKEAGIDIDIPEPHETLEENAREKSTTIYKITGKDCFSEDTGLEVASLNNEPGVKSARYAGADNDAAKNTEKLLHNLQQETNRQAQFRTVISLMLNGKAYSFEGVCKGVITETPSGTNGFGYDPVFIPEGSTKTFAEMNMDEKNQYSHRKKATAKFASFLNDYDGKD
jgi:XTP/dITP diphosphohydrolase